MLVENQQHAAAWLYLSGLHMRMLAVTVTYRGTSGTPFCSCSLCTR